MAQLFLFIAQACPTQFIALYTYRKQRPNYKEGNLSVRGSYYYVSLYVCICVAQPKDLINHRKKSSITPAEEEES